jgi:glutathione S-transferase
MALKLTFAPFTRASRPRFLLEEMGVPYELVTLDLKAGEHKGDAYRAIHPLGVVPALDDDGIVIIESAAICMHLADRFPAANMAPAPGTTERGLYYEWIVFTMATLEPRFIRFKDTHDDKEKYTDDDRQTSAHALDDALALLEARLGAPFAIGESLTAADCVIGPALVWVNSKRALDGYPRLKEYAVRIKSRPAFSKAMKP